MMICKRRRRLLVVAALAQCHALSTRRPSRFQLNMVMSTPDSVIEETSTKQLLDFVLDESLRTSARRPIMTQFDPSSKAIWKHWKGTIFAETWPAAVKRVCWAVLVYLIFKRFPAIQIAMSDFQQLWVQALSVTTFTLTFFVNQSYNLWRTCLTSSRILQGRLNDLMMALSASAIRTDRYSDNFPEEFVSTFTPSSRQFLQVVSRYIRLFSILSYASFTRSHRPILTPRGMRRMVDRGLLTTKERKILIQANIAATQRHNAVLMWLYRSILEGRRAGLIQGGPGFEHQVIAKVQEIRGTANGMEAELRGRIPFAYAHTVQVLVDLILWMYPVGAFGSGISLQIGLLGTAILTMCYQGLFDLAKQFLDPFYNENFWNGDDALAVDTLIAETNAGSLRWMYCLDEMPIPYKMFAADDDLGLDDFILPDEGITAKEADANNEKREQAEAAARANEKTRMTPQEVIQKATEVFEAAQEEYEETKRILNAPPASDFVPGLDDNGESLPYIYQMNNRTEAIKLVNSDGDILTTNNTDVFEKYVDAAEEEFHDTQQVNGLQ